ncbi:MAG: methyltransferase domain-containing protein [Chthonomonadales bacterium]
MHASTLQMLRCPDCGGSPVAARGSDVHEDRVEDAVLTCPDCGAQYPIQEGIAQMLPKDLRAPAEAPACSDEGPTGSAALPEPEEAAIRKRSEMLARDAQVQQYDRMWHLALFGLAEIPATLLHLSLEPHHTLLEAGCGTGRMTPHFAARCRHLVAVDFSLKSLKVCAAKLRARRLNNVDLVQADLCSLPFASETFHRVASCQVIEHVPTPSARAAAVAEMHRVLRTEGVAAVSAYRYAFPMNLLAPKQGEHEGGIPFIRFTREEILDLLSSSFAVHSITGALLYHYIARCVKVPNIGSSH